MADEPKAPELEKNWKYYAGMTSLALAMILPLFSFLVPSLGLSPELSATLIGALLLGGPEVFMVLAAIFLGKEAIAYFKSRVLALFKREPRPVGRTRYYVGLAILVASNVPPFLHAYFTDFLPGAPDSATRLYVLATSDAVLVASFFVMGDEFWEKLKRLVTWEGVMPAASAK